MSLYENLPVYKQAKDMTVYFYKIVRHFDRYNKYDIGQEIKYLARKTLSLITKANIKQTRKEYLTMAIDNLEELKITLNIAKDLEVFKNKTHSFGVATKLVIEVLKQCEGWLRSQNSPSGKS